MDLICLSPDLGALTILPREIRDRIYSLALSLRDYQDDNASFSPSSSCCSYLQRQLRKPRTGIVWTSKRIFEETKIAFFRTNDFHLRIDRDYRNERENRSVTGRKGWQLMVGPEDIYPHSPIDAFYKKPPLEMIPYMQNIHFTVGLVEGVKEEDIVPPKFRCISGPERPAYNTLMKVVDDVCDLLRSCHQVHILRISIRSIEETPGSIEKVMDPIRELRRIKKSHTVVWSMQDDRWVDWNLKGSYNCYMKNILALPEGAPAPKYVGDEREPNQSEEIFDIIGGRWMGGSIFSYPVDTGYEDDYDDVEDEGDFYDEFEEIDEFDYSLTDELNASHPYGIGFADDEMDYEDYSEFH